ncbi:MAG: CTP-dependent riboflavin kinase [Candidatus Bathyarchaeota archaeon]|nr:CTP-dependent riboflavin kinase [Candidatus Bathyarchaeota archaeon]
MTNCLVLDGKVISGSGEGKKYLKLGWVKKQIKQKLGFTPFLGTLNLQLSAESQKRRKILETQKSALKINPVEGYCIGLIFPANIGETPCCIVLPQVEGYPQNLLEVIAPVNLREFLHLNDGDALAVSIKL